MSDIFLQGAVRKISKQQKRHTAIPSVYGVFIRSGKVLLLERQNTGYEDGNYSFPVGHVEEGETLQEALCREVWEEVGWVLSASNVALAHVMHRCSDDDRIDFFFLCNRWEGTVTNKEPHKCSRLRWEPMAALPENTIPYISYALGCIQDRILYSDFGWKAR